MGTSTARRVRRPKTGQDPRKRKNYRLQQSKLDAARRVLGTTSETERIERALELVVFGERPASGTARARGRAWNDVVGEMERVAPGAKVPKFVVDTNLYVEEITTDEGIAALAAFQRRCAPLCFNTRRCGQDNSTDHHRAPRRTLHVAPATGRARSAL